MKILNADEADGLVPLGKGRSTWLYERLIQLKAGEAIAIPSSDWKSKDTPYLTIRKAAKNRSAQRRVCHAG